MKLSLNAFRGATCPVELDFGKHKIAIIYGENGSGKTTLVDAFDVLANDTTGSLEDKSIASKARYPASAGRKTADLRIDLTVGSDTWSATQAGAKIVKTPADNLPKVMLLRRQKITELIEETDSKKYQRIRSFVEVPELLANETALSELLKQHKSTLATFASQITYADQTLENHWQAATPEERGELSAIEWAEAEAALYDANWKATPHPHDELRDKIENLSSSLTALNQTTDAANDADAALSEASSAYQQAASANATESADALTLLQEARDYLSAPRDADIAACPVCEQSVNQGDLDSRITERLGLLADVIEKQDALKAAERRQQTTSDRLATARKTTATALSELVETDTASEASPELPDLAQLPDLAPLQAHLGDPVTAFTSAELIDQLNAIADDLNSDIDARGAVSQRRETLHQLIAQRQQAQQEAGDIERQQTLANSCYQIVRDTRKDHTDAILTEISAGVAELYAAIHPGEDLENIQLLLNPKKNASLEIKASAYGQDTVAPQGYYSESHLDTLGICIFLALARREDSGTTILIVDDAVTSVDERHLDLLVELFYAQSEHFQRIILTSHYRPWKEKYRWGHLRHSDCTFIELRDWTADKGLQFTKADRLPVDRVRQLQADPNSTPGEAVALAGVLLECLLDFLSITYQCKLARKPAGAGWTIGELFGSMNAKLKKALRVEIVDANGAVQDTKEVAALILPIHDLCGLRNCLGCHYNELGAHFPPEDAGKFVDATLALADALCDDSGALPASNKSGSYWETPDKTRRLHPLQQPQ